MIGSWTLPADDAGIAREELLVSFNESRSARVLVLPALFDEANKLRRFTVEVMRRLNAEGIDSFLPDLPGCNESLASMDAQTLTGWRTAAFAAAQALDATHCLTMRGGALMAPPRLSCWQYAPQTGAKILRSMIRARIIAAREEGRAETSDASMEQGRMHGLVMAGWPLSASMFAELETAEPLKSPSNRTIAQSDIGGAGLWLRAEPSEDTAQADALAAIIISEIGAAA